MGTILTSLNPSLINSLNSKVLTVPIPTPLMVEVTITLVLILAIQGLRVLQLKLNLGQVLGHLFDFMMEAVLRLLLSH